jgi:hypothetical protein
VVLYIQDKGNEQTPNKEENKMTEIAKIIEQGQYEVYGIRVDETIKYSVGDICNNSHQWWQDEPFDGCDFKYDEDMQCWDGGELDGTCALQVTADDLEDVLAKSEMYFGENVTLIAGNCYEEGNDIGEVIIENAKVLAIINL